MGHFKRRIFVLLIMISFIFQIFSFATVEADTKSIEAAVTNAASPLTKPTAAYFAETPASYQEVTFKVRDDVVQVDKKLGSAFQSKLKLYDELPSPVPE